MLTRVEALNFRCLRYISRSLDPFHVLVGPNASGKTTFFDVVGFVSRLLNDGLEAAIGEVTSNPMDMLFGRSGERFELGIEVALPDSIRDAIQRQTNLFKQTDTSLYTHIRYELAVTVHRNSLPEIAQERVAFVKHNVRSNPLQLDRFPMAEETPNDLCSQHVIKTIASIDPILKQFNFYPEVWEDPKSGSTGGFVPGFQLSKRKSALANVPEGENFFPATTWLKEFLKEGARSLTLDSHKMKQPSPPHFSKGFQTDGSNLPWVVSRLEGTPVFKEWIRHIQTALPDVQGVRTVIREEDRHCYLFLKYENGMEVPQWMVSDGTLRLLALTLPAFIDDFGGMLLIEEPENGIHPKAIETAYQALCTVTSAQVLLATHSPIVLNIAEPHEVLCFAKDEFGATSVVRGDEHPALIGWQHDVSLGVLFAAGVLG